MNFPKVLLLCILIAVCMAQEQHTRQKRQYLGYPYSFGYPYSYGYGGYNPYMMYGRPYPMYGMGMPYYRPYGFYG